MKWTFRRALPMWWSFVWRVVLYGAVAGLLLRAGAYVVGSVGGFDMQGAMYMASMLTVVSYIPITLMAMKQALSAHIPPVMPNNSFKPSPLRGLGPAESPSGGPA